MGTFSQLVTLIMKFLFALSSLLALTAAEWTCDDCTAVVGALATYLSSEESIDNQVAILLAEVCPQAENPDECLEQLPAFWAKVAGVLWPGYYQPDAEWMCAQEGLCGPAARDINCEECFQGIQGSIDQLLSEPFINGIVEALSGDGFCGMEEDPELCANIIAELIPLALPILAGGSTLEGQQDACNSAVPDTCPAFVL